MIHAVLALLVVLCIAFAGGIEFIAYRAHTHNVSTDWLAGAALFTAIGLALPIQFARLVNTARRIVPWMDRRRPGRAPDHPPPAQRE